MGEQSPEPDYGRRLLASLLDQRAETDGTRIYASTPITNNAADGFRDISIGALKAAVDCCAHFLDKHVGSARAGDRVTLAWLSWPQDFRYILLALAAMKTGHRMFFPSPKNSISAYHALLGECRCSIFLRPSRTPLPIIDMLVQERSMSIVEMPDLDCFLKQGANESSNYHFGKSFEDARFDECLVLHTSGSTGIPKPVVVKHGYFSAIDAHHCLPEFGAAPPAFSLFGSTRCFAPFPLFHAAGLIVHLAGPLFWDVTLAMAPSAPITVDTVQNYLDHGSIDTAFLPGATLVDISNKQTLLARMSELICVGMGGSPLPEEAGNKLSKQTRVVNLLGSTEAAKLPSEVVADNVDWQFLRFGDKTGFEFRQVEGTEKFEMIIKRTRSLDLLQAVFVTFPDLQEWNTGDLYTQHPTKPDHWKYESRSDDIIVFSTGEKLNPLTLEEAVTSNPSVSGAVVAGSGRFQACLLVEPCKRLETDADRQQFLSDIWPTVRRVNAITVTHGRVDKHLMLATIPDKPFPRSGKGSIQRKLALQLYEKELNSLYDEPGANGDEKSLDWSSEETSVASLRAIFAQAMDASAPVEDADIFAQGVDSVQVLNVVRRINRSIGREAVTPPTIYVCGTLRNLARAISASKSGPGISAATRGRGIDAVVERFTHDLPVTARQTAKSACSVVVLTGSTGSLGSYLLDALLANPNVVHVYCLNRSSDAPARQVKANTARGLASLFPPHRVTFLQSDFSKAYLGLALHSYRDLLDGVTHIVHNAWEVNFNLALDSFIEAHVNGVRGLVDFSAHSKHGAHIYFLSSIGTVQGFGSSGQLNSPTQISEKIFADSQAPGPMGYSESKHVSERLLAQAAEVSGVSSTVCRLGQIAGPVKRGLRGMWSKQEWLPSLVVSSGTMGMVPDSLGVMDQVDWLPVDILAELVIDLMLQQKSGCDSKLTEVHHLVNPRRCTWSRDLVKTVMASKHAKPTTLSDWVERLGKIASGGDAELAEYPAIKLLAFFESLASDGQASATGKSLIMDTAGTKQKSGMLRDVDAVSGEWMELWIQQWAK